MRKFKKILIYALLLFPAAIFAQNGIKIEGKVIDSAKEPLIGAAVVEKSTNKGVVTNADGDFSLNVSKNFPVTLIVNYIGYKQEEVIVYSADEPVIINMKDFAGLLDEVVVVGYTTAKKSSYTGSVAVVGVKELDKLQITSTGKALQGTVPGLQSIAQAGQPGSDAALYVRGIGSVNASNSPLYVVDGVAGANPNQISGKDIQSISVLKDATASALYGSRGANGVIVITTKQGNLNAKPTVSLSANYGFTGRAVKDYEYLTPSEYYELQWEAIRNNRLELQGETAESAALYATYGALDAATGQRTGNYSVVDVLKVNIFGPNYPTPIGTDGKLVAGATPLWNNDWGDEISRTGIRQQYDLSVSGGSANTKYFFSGGYLKEQGWIITSEFERFNLRSNIQSKVTNWFEAGANISLSSSWQRSPMQEDSNMGNFANFQRLVSNIYPAYVVNFDDGAYVLDENGNRIIDYGTWRPQGACPNQNVLGTAAHQIDGTRTDAVLLRTNFNIIFAKGLQLKSTASADYRAGTSHSYSHSYYQTGVIAEGAGTASRSSSRTFNYTLNSFLDYSLDFNEQTHSLNLMAGPEIYVTNTSSLSGSRTGFYVLDKTEPSVGSTSGTFNGTSSDYRLASFLSKLDYNYLQRYHFSTSFRRDGSSRFSKESRWGNFWSVGAAWNVKKENFLLRIKDLDNLNLRFSYGAQGNDAVGNYAYGGFYNIYNSLNTLGLQPSDLPTPELHWETNLNLNFGIDFALFDNRLIAQLDLFNRQSKDLLFTKPLAPSTGYSGIDANIGSLSNRGIDGQITGVPVRTRDFQWDVTLNFGHYTNKITKLPQKEIISGNYNLTEGGSRYDFYIKEWAGVNPETGLAQWWKETKDENGKVINKEKTESWSEATLGFRGSSLPDLYGGLNNSFSYKGIELAFLLSYSLGGKVYDNDYVMIMHSGSKAGATWGKEALTRWTPENTNTNFPRLDSEQGVAWTQTSTRFLYDASYARLKQFNLSYYIPRNLLRTLSLKDVRLRLTGENLLTFYGHKGFDPEQTVSGATYYRYPAQKSFSFGIDVQF